MAIITLLTDFGLKDEYVGVLKGVMLGAAPDATIVDISHGIEPQDIEGAAHALKAAYRHFPEHTVHVAVVDPGVGTQRDVIAAQCNGHLFLAPNNGLLWPILHEGARGDIHRVMEEKLFRHPVSRTFHGRDVFAPVAAHLSKGNPLPSVGERIKWEQVLPLGSYHAKEIHSGHIVGHVIAVDRFGNLISDITIHEISKLKGERLTVTAGDYTIDHLTEAYAESEINTPMAIIGSRDCLEIAINSGNASRVMKLGKGAAIRVEGFEIA